MFLACFAAAQLDPILRILEEPDRGRPQKKESGEDPGLEVEREEAVGDEDP